MKGLKTIAPTRYLTSSLMSNIRRLKKTRDAVNVAIIDANAIMDTVARKLNKENTSYYSKRTNKQNRQEHRNNKISRNED